MIAAIYAFVLALVLAVAPRAAATCAWILWAETFSLDKGAPPGSWHLWEAAESLKRCQEYRDFRVGKHGTEYKDDRGFTVLTRYLCLPDTIDPRGPKAGGR